MTDELDVLVEQVGRRGFMVHAFRGDRHGPYLLAAVYDFGGCVDVVILIDTDRACAYRTTTVMGTDLFAPTEVYWSYAGSPVWTLRALLTLAPPGQPEAPTELTRAPNGLGIPTEMRWPVALRRRSR